MAYNEKLAERIRNQMKGLRKVEEKKMMGGLTFMYKGKMCAGVIKDDLLVRIDPALHDDAIKKPGARTMDFTKRPMSGFVQVSPEGLRSAKALAYWIKLAIDYNQFAKVSRKRKHN